MTENKRYKISDVAHYVYSDIYDGNEILRNDEVVDLLNEQSDKITEQAIQIDFLKDENKHMRQVLEENRQLKKIIKEHLDYNPILDELGVLDD